MSYLCGLVSLAMVIGIVDHLAGMRARPVPLIQPEEGGAKNIAVSRRQLQGITVQAYARYPEVHDYVDQRLTDIRQALPPTR
jgi:hypothetical protein